MSLSPADQARLAVIQIKLGIVPGLAQLTPQQIQKGIENVLNRTQDQDRPPAHIIARNERDAAERERFSDDLVRTQERPAAPEADVGGSVHELPTGSVADAREDTGVLLPHAVHDGLGNKQTGQHQDVRRPGAGESRGIGERPVIQPNQAAAGDDLDDIHRQIAAAKNANEINKGLPVVLAVEAVAARGPILASNRVFVAVSTGRQITIFRIDDLENVVYDGTCVGSDRFAKGNKLEINKTKEGLKTVVGEERPEVQTEAKKKIVRDRGVGRG